MSVSPDSHVRRCRRCSHRLDEVRGHLCPQCGEGFDLGDVRTYRIDLIDRVLLLQGNAGGVRIAELNLLRSGIAAIVQEDYNAAGGPTASLWVARDEYDAAAAALTAPPETGEAWTCRCGEEHEGQFGECWSCGEERPAGAVAVAAASVAPAATTAAATDTTRTVAVPDVDELVAFYREVFGLEPVRAGRAPHYEQDGVILVVQPWAGDDAAADTGANDPRPVFRFEVVDLDEVIERLVAAGAAFVDDEPVVVPGGRVALFVDPFGVVHEVFEADADADVSRV
jgi:predicted enzyme related to lactoylglutathione lyase